VINQWLKDTEKQVTWDDIMHDNEAQLKVGLTATMMAELKAQALARIEENEEQIRLWNEKVQKLVGDKKTMEHTKSFHQQMANGKAVIERAWKVIPTPEIMKWVSQSQNNAQSASSQVDGVVFDCSLCSMFSLVSFVRFCCLLIAFSIFVQCPNAMKDAVDPPKVEDFVDVESVYCGMRKGRSGFLSVERRRFNDALAWLFPIHAAIVDKQETTPDPRASHRWFSIKFEGHPSIGNLGAFRLSELPLPFINRAQLDLAEKVSSCEHGTAGKLRAQAEMSCVDSCSLCVIFDCFCVFLIAFQWGIVVNKTWLADKIADRLTRCRRKEMLPKEYTKAVKRWKNAKNRLHSNGAPRLSGMDTDSEGEEEEGEEGEAHHPVKKEDTEEEKRKRNSCSESMLDSPSTRQRSQPQPPRRRRWRRRRRRRRDATRRLASASRSTSRRSSRWTRVRRMQP
jgi:regulator of replication initiation timing